MTDLHLVDDEPPPVSTEAKLLEYGVAWHEAQEIAEAYRVRLQRAVLAAIDDGMSAPQAAALARTSRVTVNSWRRQRRAEEAAPAAGTRGSTGGGTG